MQVYGYLPCIHPGEAEKNSSHNFHVEPSREAAPGNFELTQSFPAFQRGQHSAGCFPSHVYKLLRDVAVDKAVGGIARNLFKPCLVYLLGDLGKNSLCKYDLPPIPDKRHRGTWTDDDMAQSDERRGFAHAKIHSAHPLQIPYGHA